MKRPVPLLLHEMRPRATLGIALAGLAVTATTALSYPLRETMPEASTGVLYLLPVVVISIFWGLRLGLLTGLLSATAFNFFHIPPTGRFHVADPEHWVALGVFLIAAIMVSSVAELARARAVEAEIRRREAELTAEMARLLLGHETAEALPAAAARIASALGLDWTRIVPAGPSRADPHDPTALGIPLGPDGGAIGTLLVPADADGQAVERLNGQVAPALETLLAAALERERLQSDAVEADALRRSDEIKTALLRSVSHDLRTPLTAIVAAGDALGSPELSRADREELAETVTGQASRLARFVDHLLDLSRLEAGAAEPRRSWCSLEEIAQEAIAQIADGTRFELSIDPDLPLIEVDAVQIERALVNVLENAARYTDDGPVSVRAGLVGSELIVRVVDHGPGIPEGEHQRVFEPFYRSNGGKRPGDRGSGLGLAIAKGFVEANGARIWVESPAAGGTAIAVALPAELQAEAGGVGVEGAGAGAGER